MCKYCRFLIVCVCVVMMSCSTQRLTSVPEGVECSPSFQLFWKDYVAETAGVKNLKHWVPSEDFVGTYGLTGGDFVMSGFVYTDDTFDAEKTDVKGLSLNPYQEYVYSYRIPVRSVEQLLQVKGVRRIEISKQNKTKIK